MPTLLIIRGLPGSGKTTLAKEIATPYSPWEAIAADDYMVDDEGNYAFSFDNLPRAHQMCKINTRNWLAEGHNVVVHNTFTQRWEMEPYIKMAKDTKSHLVVVSLFDGGLTDDELHERCIHDVPMATFKKMRKRYEHDWKNGDPLAPWQKKKATSTR